MPPRKKKEDNMGLCNDCTSSKTGPPLGPCVVVQEIQKMINQYSGTKNRMRIQVTRCHHKNRKEE